MPPGDPQIGGLPTLNLLFEIDFDDQPSQFLSTCFDHNADRPGASGMCSSRTWRRCSPAIGGPGAATRCGATGRPLQVSRGAELAHDADLNGALRLPAHWKRRWRFAIMLP